MKWLFGAFITVSAIVFIVLYNAPSDSKSVDYQSVDLMEDKLAELPSGFINDRDVPMQCNVTPAVGDPYRVGIVPPGKSFSTSKNDSVSCKWKDIDYTGCENSSFLLCELVQDHPNIRDCMQWDMGYQNFCAAYILRNVNVCEPILDKPRRALCFTYQLDDLSYCLDLDENRDWCLKDYALNKGNASICELIKDQQEQAYCLSIASGNVTGCRGNTICVTMLAQLSHDISLCSYADDIDACRTETNKFI